MDKYNDFIYGLLHSFRSSFDTCELIMEGLSYPKKIPNDFWEDDMKGAEGVLGEYRISKSQMKQLRSEVIDIIAKKIVLMENENNDRNQVDNFVRMFHALTILEVEKNTTLVPVTSENIIYNISYRLWLLDDGSEEVWKLIAETSWYSAEAIKRATSN